MLKLPIPVPIDNITEAPHRNEGQNGEITKEPEENPPGSVYPVPQCTHIWLYMYNYLALKNVENLDEMDDIINF